MYLLTILLCLCVTRTRGYGRLLEPPSRGSLWRFGYDSPVNVDDDKNDCGGTDRMWHVNSGNCGMCGDPYDLPVPRPHEIGGLYGKGLITRSYLPGEYIDVEVYFTRNAGGYFQFSICKIEDFVAGRLPTAPVNGTARRRRGHKPIKCKNRRELDVQGKDEPLFTINSAQNHYHLRVKLPKKYQCQWCVLIWEYWTETPCGFDHECNSPQGQLKTCADISILSDPMEAKYPVQTTTTSTTTETLSTDPVSPDTGSASGKFDAVFRNFESFKNYLMDELPEPL